MYPPFTQFGVLLRFANFVHAFQCHFSSGMLGCVAFVIKPSDALFHPPLEGSMDGLITGLQRAGNAGNTHVLHNTEALIDKYQPLVAKDADGPLNAIGVSSQQAAADLKRLGELVKSRQKEQAAELEALHRRYLEAAPPREGEHHSLAYRLRLLFLDRWNLWHRLKSNRSIHSS
jgi:hypothetical protein